MSDKLKQSLWTVAIVFVAACATQFLANVTDVFATDWATWKIVLNSGVVAVVAYVLAWLAPMLPTFGLGSK